MVIFKEMWLQYNEVVQIMKTTRSKIGLDLIKMPDVNAGVGNSVNYLQTIVLHKISYKGAAPSKMCVNAVRRFQFTCQIFVNRTDYACKNYSKWWPAMATKVILLLPLVKGCRDML